MKSSTARILKILAVLLNCGWIALVVTFSIIETPPFELAELGIVFLIFAFPLCNLYVLLEGKIGPSKLLLRFKRKAGGVVQKASSKPSAKNPNTLRVVKVVMAILNSALLGLLAIGVLLEGVSGMDYSDWASLLVPGSTSFFTLGVILLPQMGWSFRWTKKTMAGAGRVTKKHLVPLTVIIGAGVLCLITAMLIAGRDMPPDTADLILKRPDVPDEQNAFFWFAAAAEALFWPDGGEDAVFGYLYATMPDEPPDEALIEKTFEMNKAVFTKIEQGLQQEVFSAPSMTYEDLVDPFSSGFMSHLSDWRSLARLMAVRVRFERENGRYPEAVDVAVMLLGFCDMITNDADILIQYLVGDAIIFLGLGLTLELVRDDGVSLEQLIALSRAFERMRPLETGLVRGLKGEYDLVSELIERIERGEDVDQIGFDSSLIQWMLVLNRYTGYFLQPNRTKKIHADNTRKVVENAGRCYAEIEFENIVEFSRDPVGFADIIGHLPARNSLGRLLVTRISLTDKRLLTRSLRSECNISAARLIIALHAYKKAEEVVPERLDELVPIYISDVPRDPFDGESFRYNPSLDVVYSVGQELQDHGGRPVLFARCSLVWSGDYFVYEVGINAGSFQEEVKKVVLGAGNAEERAGAAGKLDDREILKRVAEEDKDPAVRRAARERLSVIGP